MKMHELKTEPPNFDRVWVGAKPAECRFDDREYAVGDLLWLREYNPPRRERFDIIAGEYTGREIVAIVTSMIPMDTFPGLAKGYCLLGIRPVFRRIEFGAYINYCDGGEWRQVCA